MNMFLKKVLLLLLLTHSVFAGYYINSSTNRQDVTVTVTIERTYYPVDLPSYTMNSTTTIFGMLFPGGSMSWDESTIETNSCSCPVEINFYSDYSVVEFDTPAPKVEDYGDDRCFPVEVGCLDGASVDANGVLTVSGWAMGGERINLYIDGEFIGDTQDGGYRPDVALAYPAFYGFALWSGWSFQASDLGLSSGDHIVEARSADTNTKIGSTSIFIN